jgi:hypothetical protein
MIQVNRSKALQSIGFLTITRDEDQGLFGGYLVLNSLGRPLEFHCTAPVRATRAQQILYGPTLDPYLCGERIGQTLLKTSKHQPLFVLTDVEAVMAARDLVPTPLLLIDPGTRDDGSDASTTARSYSAGEGRRPAGDDRVEQLRRFRLGQYGLAVSASHSVDTQLVTESWPVFADRIDMDEPFERIREAIGEARSSVR